MKKGRLILLNDKEMYDTKQSAAADTAKEGEKVTLSVIRERIDAVDNAIRELLLDRLECSKLVAEYKISSGDYSVYRPDREEEMVRRLSADVPEVLRKHYISSLKAIISESRAYQYDLIFDRKKEEVLAKVMKSLTEKTGDGGSTNCGSEVSVKIKGSCSGAVSIRMTNLNVTEAVPRTIAAINDYGFKLESFKYKNTELDFCGYENEESVCAENGSAEGECMEFVISGNIDTEHLARLIFRLLDETGDIKIG